MNRMILYSWRRNKGLTQQALADLWGVHRQTVNRWESGVLPVPKYVETLVQQDVRVAALKRLSTPRKSKSLTNRAESK